MAAAGGGVADLLAGGVDCGEEGFELFVLRVAFVLRQIGEGTVVLFKILLRVRHALDRETLAGQFGGTLLAVVQIFLVYHDVELCRFGFVVFAWSLCG